MSQWLLLTTVISCVSAWPRRERPPLGSEGPDYASTHTHTHSLVYCIISRILQISNLEYQVLQPLQMHRWFQALLICCHKAEFDVGGLNGQTCALLGQGVVNTQFKTTVLVLFCFFSPCWSQIKNIVRFKLQEGNLPYPILSLPCHHTAQAMDCSCSTNSLRK